MASNLLHSCVIMIIDSNLMLGMDAYLLCILPLSYFMMCVYHVSSKVKCELSVYVSAVGVVQ